MSKCDKSDCKHKKFDLLDHNFELLAVEEDVCQILCLIRGSTMTYSLYKSCAFKMYLSKSKKALASKYTENVLKCIKSVC